MLFRRTATTAALPEPTRGSLDELWQVLNVAEADRPVLAAVLVAALIPDMPHPIVLVQGEHGAGKSTGTKTIASVIDPSTVPLRKPPRDLDQWTTAAIGSHVVAVDNLSTLPDWLSDALCRASTGDGDVRRKLYTDGDLHVVSFRRQVFLNGIDLGAIRDDLADRLVTIELHRIDETKRLRDSDLASAWKVAHPKALGGLLDLAVQVLATRDEVVLERSPRMADFAHVLATVDLILGTDGMSRYRALAGTMAEDSVTNNPVTSAMSEVIRTQWQGSMAELLDLLDEHRGEARPAKGWPTSARQLSALLKRSAPSLRRVGWKVEQTDQHSERGLVWSLVPAPVADETLTKTDELTNARVSSAVSSAVRQPDNARLASGDAESVENPDELTTKPPNLFVLTGRKEEGEPNDDTTRVVPDLSSVRQSVIVDHCEVCRQPLDVAYLGLFTTCASCDLKAMTR
jgi:hypothetical protein